MTNDDTVLTDETGDDERDDKGRFTKGNQAAARGSNRRGLHFRTLLADAITDEDFETIIKTLVVQATQGDLHAIRIILDRVIGRPIGEADLHDLEKITEEPITADPEQARLIAMELLNDPDYLDWQRSLLADRYAGNA